MEEENKIEKNWFVIVENKMNSSSLVTSAMISLVLLVVLNHKAYAVEYKSQNLLLDSNDLIELKAANELKHLKKLRKQLSDFLSGSDYSADSAEFILKLKNLEKNRNEFDKWTNEMSSPPDDERSKRRTFFIGK